MVDPKFENHDNFVINDKYDDEEVRDLNQEDYYDDQKGHILLQNQPLAVCDKTAKALSELPAEIFVSESTWHYTGGGCC